MTRTQYRGFLFLAPLTTIAAGAWVILIFGEYWKVAPVFCASGAFADQRLVAEAFEFVQFNDMFVATAVMLAAMMTPTIATPIRYIYEKIPKRNNAPAISLFVLGYALVWLSVGICLWYFAIWWRMTTFAVWWSVVPFAVLVMVWQFSPIKQKSLNKCHVQPNLRAFIPTVLFDAFAYGLSHGFWCIVSCWALMLAVMTVSSGHLLAMIGCTVWIIVERLDKPAMPSWKFRMPLNISRLILNRMRHFLRNGSPLLFDKRVRR